MVVENSLFENPLARIIVGTDDDVLYNCSCACLKPISRLYFCRHCTKLRCSQCVSHEVDSYYCPNCLENMPSAEAKLKKNRCANCHDCPCCGTALAVRATAVSMPSPGSSPGTPTTLEQFQGKSPTSKKVHYLKCPFCYWSSRDVGLPDHSTASGGWQEVNPPSSRQISSLLDYYKQLAHQEKMDRESKRMTKRKTYLNLTDRYGLALALGKRQSSSSATALANAILGKGKQLDEDLKQPVITESLSEVDPLPESFYTEEINLDKVPSIQQRLKNPGRQPTTSKEMHPRHRQMQVRCSMRCKECEHNLSKPEFNPSSIKFKIQLGALYYIPQLRIAKVGELKYNEESEFILTLTNPIDKVMHVNLTPIEDGDEGYDDTNASINLPKIMIPVAAKDAATEFDEFENNAEVFNDDPNVIKDRQLNKVWFYVKVRPCQPSGEIKAIFKLTYEYKTITTIIPRPTAEADPKGSDEVTVCFQFLVHMKLGCLGDDSGLPSKIDVPTLVKQEHPLGTDI